MMLLREPLWDHSYVIYEKRGETPGHNRIAIAGWYGGKVGPVPSKGVSEGDNFYTINGRAVLATSLKGKQTICVHPYYPTLNNGDRICHVYQAGNREVWKADGGNFTIEITLQASCGPLSDKNQILVPGDCFAPLRQEDCKFACAVHSLFASKMLKEKSYVGFASSDVPKRSK
jgi:hypothetical protein